MTLTNCTCSLPPVEASRRVRSAQAAGAFYPQSPQEIASEAKRLVESAPRKSSLSVPIALAPHAAWFYSGHIAAASIRELPPGLKRLFVLAGNHNPKANFQGISVERAHEFRMPGFSLPVDQTAVNKLLRRSGFSDVPEAHDAYVIEVELPLVRAALHENFSVVPLIVGRIGRQDVPRLARELSEAAGAPGDAFLFSLDMSHFYPDAKAREQDSFCLNALTQMDADAIAQCVTDGTGMLLVMNELAALRDLTPRVLAYANSSEAPEGDVESVVGYGAVIYEDKFVLSESEGEALTSLARSALETRIRGGRFAVPEALLARFPRLKSKKSAFVTLTKDGRLRGCIGSLEATQRLADEAASNAVDAALRDPRFPPVAEEELASIELSVSVLGTPRPSDLWHPAGDEENAAEVQAGDGQARPSDEEASPFARGLAVLARRRPGVTLSYRGRTSTFLPIVWEQLPDPEAFLGELCLKQGSPADCWKSPEARFETYSAQEIREKRH